MKKLLSKIPDFAKNKYFITGFIFVIWILFFDSYNFIYHWELKDKKQELLQEHDRLKVETEKNKKFIQKLNEPNFAEKYAREKFLMKKDSEDIFIIDTIK
jgi:cell division protein DivIC